MSRDVSSTNQMTKICLSVIKIDIVSFHIIYPVVNFYYILLCSRFNLLCNHLFLMRVWK